MFGLRIRQNYWREPTFADHPDFAKKVCDLLHQDCFANSPNSLPFARPPRSSSTVLHESCYKRGLDANKLWGGRERDATFQRLTEECWDRLPRENSVATGLSGFPAAGLCYLHRKRTFTFLLLFWLVVFYVVFILGVDSLIVWSCSKICLELLKSMSSVSSTV